jgi:hypothetical protein
MVGFIPNAYSTPFEATRGTETRVRERDREDRALYENHGRSSIATAVSTS